MKNLLQSDHVFTVENAQSGEYRTFRVETQPPGAKFAPGERILSLLVGPENSKNYQGFAFVRTDPVDGTARVNVWTRKRGENGEKSDYERFSALLSYLERTPENLHQYVIHEATACRRCGGLLTRPQSIRLGIGPVCADRQP